MKFLNKLLLIKMIAYLIEAVKGKLRKESGLETPPTDVIRSAWIKKR